MHKLDPIERLPDGTLFRLTPGQLRSVRGLTKCCCNFLDGDCLLLDGVCPQHISLEAYFAGGSAAPCCKDNIKKGGVPGTPPFFMLLLPFFHSSAPALRPSSFPPSAHAAAIALHPRRFAYEAAVLWIREPLAQHLAEPVGHKARHKLIRIL